MATNSARKSNTSSKSRQGKNLKVAGRRKLATLGSESSSARKSSRPVARAGGKNQSRSIGETLIDKVSGATKSIRGALGIKQTRSKHAR